MAKWTIERTNGEITAMNHYTVSGVSTRVTPKRTKRNGRWTEPRRRRRATRRQCCRLSSRYIYKFVVALEESHGQIGAPPTGGTGKVDSEWQ